MSYSKKMLFSKKECYNAMQKFNFYLNDKYNEDKRNILLKNIIEKCGRPYKCELGDYEFNNECLPG